MSDRHGRVPHVDGDARRRPVGGFRLRNARRFRALVEDCIEALPPHLGRRAATARLLVVDVPPGTVTSGAVALYDRGANALTVFRRTAELRADSRAELTEVVRRGVATAVGSALGFDVDDLDDPWLDRDD